MRSRFKRRAAAAASAALWLCFLGTPAHAADIWFPLPDSNRTLTIEGQPVAITIRPEIAFTNVDGKPVLLGRFTAGLGDLQARAPAILQTLASSKSNCETRWSFPRLDASAVSEGRLRFPGAVRVEQWLCTRFLKTRIAQETADFVIALHPQFTPAELSVDADIEKLDLGNSLIGALGLGGILTDILSSALSEALNAPGSRLGFPAEIAALNPEFTSAALIDAGGVAELTVEARASLAAADIARLKALLAKRN